MNNRRFRMMVTAQLFAHAHILVENIRFLRQHECQGLAAIEKEKLARLRSKLRSIPPLSMRIK